MTRSLRDAQTLSRKERVGPDGRRLQLLTFRSLSPSSDVESEVRWTFAQDQGSMPGWAMVNLVRTIGAVLGPTGG
jgi:hypothetical protein